jgi:hypothetical protein
MPIKNEGDRCERRNSDQNYLSDKNDKIPVSQPFPKSFKKTVLITKFTKTGLGDQNYFMPKSQQTPVPQRLLVISKMIVLRSR